jgi:DNA-binding NarL/FixJ family response regulator
VTDREQLLAGLLDAVVDGGLEAYLERPPPDDDPTYVGALRILALLLSLRWQEAAELGDTVPPARDDDEAGRWTLEGARAWAAAGDPWSEGRQLGRWLEQPLPDAGEPLGRFAGHLLVEAALAHARLDIAEQVATRIGPLLWEPLTLAGSPHAFSAMAEVCRVRLAAFRGNIELAAQHHRAIEPQQAPRIGALVAATGCLVFGNDADPGEVRRLVAEVDSRLGGDPDLMTAGSQLLTAFGLVAVGDIDEAARRALAAGGDADLGALNVIDRALGLELLVAMTVATGDLDAAEAWRDRAAGLVASPIGDSTAARIHSRVALARGHADEALVWAERAVERARETDRVIEHAEGQIVASRARISQHSPGGRSAAVRELEALVAAAEQRGHRSARRSAARLLRPIGMRLRPLAGSGWAGLSPREELVAGMVIDGLSNKEIAARLYVSEHTVRAHVSRVLAAFEVATRAALPRASGGAPSGSAPGAGVRRPLTPSQDRVAALVGRGLGNVAIASRLDISVRTVEKHVSDILVRWDLSGRTAIAKAVTESAAE